MPEPIAWIIVLVTWVGVSYLIGNDKTKIFDDDNSWPYRIFRGIASQIVVVIAVGIVMLVIWAAITIT